MTVKELIDKLESFNDPNAPVILSDLKDDDESGNYELDDRSIGYAQGENSEGEDVMGVLLCFSNYHID